MEYESLGLEYTSMKNEKKELDANQALMCCSSRWSTANKILNEALNNRPLWDSNSDLNL